LPDNKIAILVNPQVGTFIGQSRCYELDPPKDFGDVVADHVTIYIQPAFASQDAEVGVVPATASGAALGHSVRRRPGSFVPHSNPKTPAEVEGCYAWALLTLGGYELGDS
jgi:hypothetical protein